MSVTYLSMYVVFILVPLFAILSYYLGKRKTQTPKLATLIGFILAFIPPLALIYIAVLVIKDDVQVTE
ncbi:hypothetical protein [Idiomarina ramblicola]|uniref:Uncharacterized protein n=1 Tax=Idiomarina ramblicola TaxID=263724 RepID=A0A432YYR1_9GAMM|nr:hypothetical protein [Idiomarina ramblicola]RUO68751.1 hypothetical protein CWI78_07480 [Idiomarina ramblicola]